MENTKIKRNVTLFVVVVLLISTIGGIIMATVGEIGGLVFIVGPILMAILLRTLGRDGWQDAGLRLHLKVSWRWYLFSLLVYPVIIVLAVAIGVLFGVTEINGRFSEIWPLFIAGMGVQLFPRMLYSMFEEWGWRGYLEPRLTLLGVSDLPRHLFVGFIWAIWHFPLIFATDYTEIPFPIYLPIFVIGTMLTAVVYGQMRKASHTVWTSVLMHGVANTFLWSIIENDLVSFNNKLMADAADSFLMISIWAVLAWWIFTRYSRSTESKLANHEEVGISPQS